MQKKTLIIPSSFQLGGKTIRVQFDPTLAYREKKLGTCEYDQQLITLQPSSQQAPHPEETTEETFYHEMVHMILEFMGAEELNKDEAFVVSFSNFLYQSLKTFKYDENPVYFGIDLASKEPE